MRSPRNDFPGSIRGRAPCGRHSAPVHLLTQPIVPPRQTVQAGRGPASGLPRPPRGLALSESSSGLREVHRLPRSPCSYYWVLRRPVIFDWSSSGPVSSLIYVKIFPKLVLTKSSESAILYFVGGSCPSHRFSDAISQERRRQECPKASSAIAFLFPTRTSP